MVQGHAWCNKKWSKGSVDTKTTHLVGKGFKTEPGTVEGGGLKDFGSVKTMIAKFMALHQSHHHHELGLHTHRHQSHHDILTMTMTPIPPTCLALPTHHSRWSNLRNLVCKFANFNFTQIFTDFLLQISISLSKEGWPTFLFQALAPCPCSLFRSGDRRPLLPEP